jgi:hypothetical protein
MILYIHIYIYINIYLFFVVFVGVVSQLMAVITMVSTIQTIPAPRSEAPVLHVPDGVVVFGSLSGSWAWMGVAIGQSIVSIKWGTGCFPTM